VHDGAAFEESEVTMVLHRAGNDHDVRVESDGPEVERQWWAWLPYIYLLRVHVIVAIVLVALPLFGRTSPLLNGLFDLEATSVTRTFVGMMLITLAALTTALTVLATSWNTIYNAPERFGASRIPWVRFPIQWPEREMFSLLAAPAVVTVIWHSSQRSGASVVIMLLGAIAGIVLAIVALTVTNRVASWLSKDVRRPYPRTWIARRLQRVVRWVSLKPGLRDGFVDPETAVLRDGHLMAAIAFTESAGLYIVIGLSKYGRLGLPTYVSTLACVLLLTLMLCWFATGLAFFFDHYRVPVLVPLLLLPAVTAWLPWSDHFYRTYPGAHGYSAGPGPILNIDSDLPAIVVAANGGGIQAAAWTARVLTGLDRALRPEFGDTYGKSIRLISAVSGGGVGAMHFAAKYAKGRVDPNDMDLIVKQADASSLDEVAWGAAYPDFWRAFVPLPLRAAQFDRGEALESAWIAHDPRAASRLAEWRLDASLGDRPGLIFNATLVDTGERLLVGTTRVGWSEFAGLRNFEDQYPDTDIQVATAARLSASFTYVSPAARSDKAGPDFHVVDGGYYDNYGMSTALAWINQGLGESGLVNHLLLLQVRGAPSTPRAQPDSWHGWFYQAWAPIESVLQVRTTGQRSHNDDELERLVELWCQKGVRIDTATFEFPRDDAPLSWHLTGADKRRLDDEWARQAAGSGVAGVRDFLRIERLKTTDRAAYRKAIACPPPADRPQNGTEKAARASY
jgi:patatin-like phospholipase